MVGAMIVLIQLIYNLNCLEKQNIWNAHSHFRVVCCVFMHMSMQACVYARICVCA